MNVADPIRIRVGRGFGAASVALAVTGVTTLAVVGGWSYLFDTDAIYFGVLGFGLGVLTWVMIPSQARNGAVWALAWAALFAALFAAGLGIAVLLSRDSFPGVTVDVFAALSPADFSLPAATALHFRFWTVPLALWLPLTLGLLLFPDGRPPSPRWKWVGWWSVFSMTVASVATAIAQHPRSALPVNSGTYPGVLGVLNDTSFLLASVSALVSVASLVVRYRRSTGVIRSQIRWIALGGAVFAAALILGPQFDQGGSTSVVSGLLGVGTFSLLVVSFGIAIMKHRLYEIDMYISRTVTYAVLAGFITGVYALLVVGIGSLLGGGDEPNLVLSIAAVAVVAVAFEPLRSRVQRGANRLVFGKRATPYEVLSKTTARLAESGSSEERLAQVTQLVVDGTGASEAVLWLKVGHQLQPHSATPAVALSGLVVSQIVDQQPPEVPGDAAALVRHRDELLGVLSITTPRGQSVTGPDEKVLADVAAGSGLLLRNIGLNAELADRAEQLRESRRRLVAAHDAERHRLERDLHDGAQQQVVALKVKLGIAETLAEREGAEKVVDIVKALASTTQDAVDAMRAVAHGIYPPLLEAEGLEVALASATRSFPIPIALEFVAVERYERSVEESLYFCVLETITCAVDNGATRINVSLTGVAGSVEFIVRHNGEVGDLIAVEDRVEAFGGSLHVDRSPGEVSTAGRLPSAVSSLEQV